MKMTPLHLFLLSVLLLAPAWDDYKEITRKLDTFDGYDVVTGESVNFEEPLTVAGRSALVVHLPYNDRL
jgi:hypothetical protein